MKHQHSADATVKVEIPTSDILMVINGVTDAALIIIAAATAASLVKSLFSKEHL